jgi:hypothetical protein
MLPSRATVLASLSSVFCLLAACSSGDGGEVGGGGTPPPGVSAENGDGSTSAPPLTPRAVCATVETGAAFGQGCSGAGSGDAVCALSDSRCGSDACVFDSRDDDTFALYCAPKCIVGDATRCPIGYECVEESSSCGATSKGGGVCARRADNGCDSRIEIRSGTFFEGPSGELYHLAADYGSKRVTLSTRSGLMFDEVSSWDGSGGNIIALVRNKDRLLLVTDDMEVLIEGGKATPRKRAGTSSSSSAYGVAKDGSFVSLQSTGGSESFAALSRRGDDGVWTELGPTRQRVSKIESLTSGFLAVCQKTLCSSADGEVFTPVTLPAGATLDDESTYAAVGASVDDFYLTVGGGLWHQRRGAWVEEGPRGAAQAVDAGSYPRPDLLRSFADGTVVFHTWNGKGYSTYVGGDDCWSFSTGGNLDNTALVKSADINAFVWAHSYERIFCSMPAR